MKRSIVLNYWQEKYRDKGVEYISVHEFTSDINALEDLLKGKNNTCRICVDNDIHQMGVNGVTCDQYTIGRIRWHPTTYSIDKTGIVRFRDSDLVGGTLIDNNSIERKIDELLAN